MPIFFRSFCKKIARQCCLLGLLFVPCLAFANAQGTKVFSHFSIDVLPNWLITEDNSIVNISHPKNICALSIMAVPHQNVPLRELGIAFYQNFNGKHARFVDNGMTFDLITENNMPSVARLSLIGSLLYAVTVMGQCEEYEHMVYSLRRIDEKKQVDVNIARVYPLLGEAAEKSYAAAKQAIAKKAAQAQAEQEKAVPPVEDQEQAKKIQRKKAQKSDPKQNKKNTTQDGTVSPN